MPQSAAREAVVTLRLKVEDREAMKSAAQKEGLSFSAWSRKILLAAARKRKS